MMKKIFVIASLFVLLKSSQMLAQGFAPVGTAVAQFLEIGLGARAAGMGEAYTAIPTDASAAYWNPAGLAEVRGRNLFTAYAKWPAEIAIAGFALAYGLGNKGTICLSSTYLLTDDMDVTTIYQPEGTGAKFGISNYALGLSYARFLTDRFSIGVTGKYVREKYWTFGYGTWALDIGTLYRTGFHGMRLAMSILHFGSDINFDGSYIDYSDPRSVDVNKPKTFEKYSLPINFRFGIALDLLDQEQHKITTAADMIHPNNNIEQYNLGMEYGFHQSFFLRGGYKFTADEGGLALGAGFRFNIASRTSAAFDYAFADYGILGGIHRVSFIMNF